MNNKNAVSQISLKELFAERFFKIPDYQRGYSWESRQRQDLISDIEETLHVMKSSDKKGYRHYMGTIVAYPNASEHVSDEVLDVVDGQQRLTSLILLISEIINSSNRLNDSIKSQLAECFIAAKIGRKIPKDRFESGMQRSILRDILQNKEPAKKENLLNQDRNIIEAKNEFCKEVSRWDKEGITEQVVETITEHLGLILFVPVHESVIGRMFEVINNRGKALSELEMLKNYFIYFADRCGAHDLKGDVNGGWREILTNIQAAGFQTTAEENEFLKVCWLIFGSPKQKDNAPYASFKTKIEEAVNETESYDKVREFFGLISEASESLRKLFTVRDTEGKKSTELDFELEKIQNHSSHLAILPLYLAMQHSKAHKLNDEQKLTIVKLLERLNFRYYVSGLAKRNDSHHAELFRAAYSFYHGVEDILLGSEEDGYIHGYESLAKMLQKFIRDYASMDRFLPALQSDDDYYKWQGLKYFLSCYEVYKTSKNKTKSLSRFMVKRLMSKDGDGYHREHLWADKDYELESKVMNNGKFTEQKKEELCRNIRQIKRSLGNFALLSANENKALGNDPIYQKLEKISSKQVEPTTYSVKLFFDHLKNQGEPKNHYPKTLIEHHAAVIEKQQKEYLSFAKEFWAYPGEDQPISSIEVH